VQTLLQMLPPAMAASTAGTPPTGVVAPPPGPVALPVGEVVDVPRYAWRGLMVDIARHFFGPVELERVVDLMAAYKLNVLHLHLTDDQGWRLAIDAYPELAEVGGASEVGGGDGGHLTQDDYRHLVAYAARRGITVVPRSHARPTTALVSLPWLNCDSKAPSPYTGTGGLQFAVPTTLDTEFLDTVVGEGRDPRAVRAPGRRRVHATAPDATGVRGRAADIVSRQDPGRVGRGQHRRHRLQRRGPTLARAAQGGGREPTRNRQSCPRAGRHRHRKVLDDMKVGNS
jgi:hexosaminidase